MHNYGRKISNVPSTLPRVLRAVVEPDIDAGSLIATVADVCGIHVRGRGQTEERVAHVEVVGEIHLIRTNGALCRSALEICCVDVSKYSGQ